MEKIIVPPLNMEAAAEIHSGWEKMDKPDGGLGELEKMVELYVAMTGGILPEKIKAAMLLMCGDHSIAKYGVSAYPQEVTMQMINGYVRETAGANVLARHAGADVFIIDVGTAFDLRRLKDVRQMKISWGTNDFTKGPAMSRRQAEDAIHVGMQVADECIDNGYNLLATGEMGIGNTTSSAAIVSAFTGLPPEQTVGRGTGINDERMKIKRQVVTDGLTVNKPDSSDAMDILCKVGGYDHAGIAGMILAGARRRIPVMLDGVNATAAALLAYGLCPRCADYLLCSHWSAEISHKKMLEILKLKPIIDAGLRLGEGTGASLAIAVLQAAVAVYNRLSR